MDKKTAGMLACAALVALPAAAQKACSQADSAAAEKAIERVVNYAGLNKAWKDYRHCDTGSVEEVYNDAILRLMVEWKNVETIAFDVARDPEYKKFIHTHLLSPGAQVDRPSVYSRARQSCPLTQGAFCAELIDLLKPAGNAPSLAPLPTLDAPKTAPPSK